MKNICLRTLVPLLFVLLGNTPARAGEPVVMTTITPLTWLVQALAPENANVQTLLPAGQSPHDYQVKPSDVARLRASSLTVWIGPALEPWFAHLAERLPDNKHLALLPDALHQHNHEDDHENHENDKEVLLNDPHLWLDPLAMRDSAAPVAAALTRLYPQQQADIQQRLALFQSQMTALNQEIAAMFAPVQTRGFVVYHDGYQRLVQRYHLNQREAVWHHENIPTGARERAQLLSLLNSGEIRCLFYEPEHGADAVHNWLGKAADNVTMVQMDPLGQQVPPGAEQYARFMRALAGQMVNCLRN